jgi:glycosyltransferase involved in cell wall biosynthesis
VNVLVLHSELGMLRGGGENFTRNLFANFAALGHRVRVAFTADLFGRYPFPIPSAFEPVPIRGVWSEDFGQATLSSIGRRLTRRPAVRAKWDYFQNALAWRAFYWHNYRFQRRILRRLEQLMGDADAVYVHCNPYLASEVARVRPTVLRLPGPLTAEAAPVLQSIHAVCANGDALARIRTFLGDRALELPVGLDHERFAPGATHVRQACGWTNGEGVLGYVGRLSHIKGVDILAEGFRTLAQRQPGARLLFVGTGEEEQNLRATLRHEVAAGVVRFAGDVSHDELPSWYRAMDLLVMPSRYENYSNAILEGLACGVPFVGSDVGGNRTLAATGAGWLFEPGSPTALAVTLAEAMADHPERKARGARGRRYVHSGCSWAASARRLEKIIACTVAPT